MPRVGVVLPVYNQGRYVQQTLDSLFAQDYRDYEIIAVDDGSTDCSLEILNRHFGKIRVIEGPHQGAAAARNKAIWFADCEFVAFMDADDLCAHQRLRLSVEKLDERRADLVASTLTFIGSSGAPLSGIWTCPPGAANDYWGALLERNFIGTPSVMVRRATLDEAGGFDEAFTHSEDYDLWLRIGASHSITFIDTPLIQCRRHGSNTSMDIEKHQQFERLALQKVDRELARASIGRLHNDSPQRAEAWIWFLLRSGDPAFQEEVESALRAHPSSDSLAFALGVFQYDAGKYADAAATFTRLKDRDVAALNNLGVLLSSSGDRPDACIHLEAALRSRPDYYDARQNLKAVRNGLPVRLTRRPLRSQPIAMLGA